MIRGEHMTAKKMQRACANVIESRMKQLRATKDEYWPDPAGGTGDHIHKGDWMGSAFEFQLFTKLLAEIKAIK
jgi:hypothetical protein